MYTKANICIVDCDIKLSTAGEYHFDKSTGLDAEELNRLVRDKGNYVILRASKIASTVPELLFVQEGEIPLGADETNEGYKYGVVFGAYSRSLTSLFNRKMFMYFKDVDDKNQDVKIVNYTS